MTTITKVDCHNCGLENWFNPNIVHYDDVVPETNPLAHHCTFCTNTLQTNGNSQLTSDKNSNVEDSLS